MESDITAPFFVQIININKYLKYIEKNDSLKKNSEDPRQAHGECDTNKHVYAQYT